MRTLNIKYKSKEKNQNKGTENMLQKLANAKELYLNSTWSELRVEVERVRVKE